MRLRAIFISALFCLPLLSVAQENGAAATRGTVFGGYSLAHNNSNNFNGWDTQATYNFTRRLS